ncbi:MAG TPA: energy transducer TonB [Candidatus Acidoferrales bacterium]|nr:energy transducer TonB [Candidatus Acidoferrales bacterium]
MEAGERFSRCLLEQKNEESKRARRLRRRTIYLAVLIQAFILTLLLLRPLFGAQEVPMVARFIPLPPWKGGGGHPVAAPHHPASHHESLNIMLYSHITFEPGRPAPHPASESSPEISTDGDGLPGFPGPGSPDGQIPMAGPASPFRSISPPPPPAEEPPRRPRVVPPEVQQALLVVRIEPQYPALAKQMHLEGDVQLRAIIARDGAVESLEVLSGNMLLAHAACDAILRWHYRPTLLRGEPIAVETLIIVKFRMQ